MQELFQVEEWVELLDQSNEQLVLLQLCLDNLETIE